ncbi:AraC family transcriptional regulator [Paenibacillus sp. ACRSA]|uniref:ABC transporter substrate-binding protein n=1 Tax=Paenibacillus sp. ACRSA TaxID=2918211 RepID=UPI001EF5DE48|nr:ABC transporter substrate-binding protein [Paenibacillus sp. ACRSA]MCG7375516.1 AraC family transcriptional regulator [Paenibacillus sp. ACRSA]
MNIDDEVSPMPVLKQVEDTLFFSAFMFRFGSIEQRKEQPEQRMLEKDCLKHTFLICEEGTGRLYIGHKQYAFSSGRIYPLAPGESYQIEHDDKATLHYVAVEYDVFHVLTDDPELYTRSLFEHRNKLGGYAYAQLSGILESMLPMREYRTDSEYAGLNVQFQKLMGLMINRYTSLETELSPEGKVNSTIKYVDEHYAEEITVQKLAKLAGLRPAQYTTLFRQLTGRKPLDYVNHVRIQIAKEWLGKSDEPLRDIASRVGFKDEYYFSRRFRQSTGFTPRQYDRSLQRQTLVQDFSSHDVNIPAIPARIMYYGESAGDMLIMDLPILNQRAYDAVQPINVEETVEMKPDLIIFDSSDEQQFEQFSRIAPTLAYNSHATLSDRIHTIGSWFGKYAEAEDWWSKYTENEMNMWQNLQTFIQTGETASVFVYHRGARLFVMGNIGLAPMLYHPLGFKPVAKVQEALAAGRAYKEIAAEALHQYAGDRVFLMLPEDPIARQATEVLMQSTAWQGLNAVKKGHVYLLEETIWNLGDALTRMNLLSLLPELLGRRSDRQSKVDFWNNL